MFEPTAAFSGFSVEDSSVARRFYSEVLGLVVESLGYGSRLHLPGGALVFFYPKGDAHTAASYTILNFVVDDIDQAVDALQAKGVVFSDSEQTDDKHIQRGVQAGTGPDQAWFTDPSGNILSVLTQAPVQA